MSAASPFDAAVDQLLSQQYPQSVVNTINSYGDSAIGFRMAGAPADDAAANYIAAQFTGLGASSVRKEPVPVDEWALKGASVTVAGRTMTASQFPGVPGTNGALMAPIVYVGPGRADDYADVDVTGKLVLVDIEFDDYWFNMTGEEAKRRGAVGVVFTNGANTAPAHADPNGLASDESRWSRTGLPAVFVTTNDGNWLKKRLATNGAVPASVTSKVSVTMHNFANPSSGGVGYNVVAEIPGTDPNAKAIVVSAHHDAYFRGGLDDTAGVAQLLTIAKAMKMSGTQLKRPVIFMATTGEEFGYTDTQYDYLAGAWWAATKSHSSSASDPAQRWTGSDGRIALVINIEDSPQQDSPLIASATSDLAPWFASVAGSSGDLLQGGYYPSQPFTLWQDGATWAAAGVPTVVTVAEDASYEGINHTDRDTSGLIDYAYLGRLAKFYVRTMTSASTALLPHDINGQADELTASVSAADLKAVGANTQAVDALVAAVSKYKAATAAYADRRSSISPARWTAVNDQLTSLERYWYTHLSGFDAGDSSLVFPFQQTLSDIGHLEAAIGLLQGGAANADAAVQELAQVGLTSVGLQFSPDVYTAELKRYLPDYYLRNWGGQVNQFWHVDITDKVRQIEAGDFTGAINGLQCVVANAVGGVNVRGAQTTSVHIDGLDERLRAMTAALNTMTPMVDNLK
ncbi:M28 family peptidase [Kitasatospora cineracea]|uniref:M28 family peptidase n=1 Tax=Kitasatospora cineracea TaxID=88074 RepID=UPI0013C2C5FB|nr:M28 family peptidase [Kitasatospora cineracea]